jgi:acetyl-CoA synthetase
MRECGNAEMRPGFVGQPLFGTELVLLDPATGEVRASTSRPAPVEDALFCIAEGPGLTNSCINGHDKFVQSYIVSGTNLFSSGDLATFSDGYLRTTGRTDDQLFVMIEHPKVREAAVVGVAHPLRGQAIVAFAVSNEKGQGIVNEIKEFVSLKFSAIGRPSSMYIVDYLPKTRSEKIIKVLLRELLTGTVMKDLPPLKNPEVIDAEQPN